MARTCIFCASGTVTAEHVWPQWLATEVPSPMAQVTHHRATYRGKEQLDRQRWGAPSYTTRVKQVCAKCNNEWMSVLEHEARPVLSPLMRGLPQVLSEEDQDLVATWALKTAMMLEFTHPGRRAIPSEHHRWLYANVSPPSNVQLWVGQYTGNTFNTFYAHHALNQPGTDGPQDPEAYAITLGVRHLVFQLWGTALAFRVVPTGVAAAALRSIWPTKGQLAWPPRPKIDDALLRIVGNGFRNV